jgi:membrane protease subunit HflC
VRKKLLWIFLPIAIFIYLISTALFCLDETKIGIVCQFGKPVKVITEPGLKLKLPAPIQTKILFDKRVLIYDPTPTEFLTTDKQNIVIDVYVCWRITDPLKFFQTMGNRRGAELRLEDLVKAEVGAALGNCPFSTLVSYKEGEMNLSKIMNEITERSDKRATEHYGIKILDVRIKRLNFPEENRPSVFARMWAERERIATKYRSEGQEEAAKIRAEAEKQKQIILSEAYRKAEGLKGTGDAEATRIYARAYGEDPEFYKFIRTLQSYEKFLDEKATIILPGDSKLLQLLEKGPPEVSHEKE